MENASKALIIAGGVLIAIMVASLFVYLFTSYGNYSKNIYDRINQRQQTEANNEYTRYEGSEENNIYDVVTVINKAKDNNTSLNLNYGERGYITVRITNGLSGVSNTRLENLDNSQMVNLLQVYADAGALFGCRVNENDGVISEVIFNKI